MKARKGFTLMELLVVVLVMATLAGIMVPRIVDFQKNAKIQNCNANVVNLKKALERYAVDNEGVYPADDSAFQALFIGTELAPADTKYFPHGGPVCPRGVLYVYSGGATGGTIASHDHSSD